MLVFGPYLIRIFGAISENDIYLYVPLTGWFCNFKILKVKTLVECQNDIALLKIKLMERCEEIR